MSQAAKQRDEITRLGFWLYILSDVMIFGVLFATFMVLRHNVAGGAGIEQIVNAPYVLIQTLLLLTSSFTCAMALAAVRFNKLDQVKLYLGMTWLLGASFLVLEVFEFWTLSTHGDGWWTSAFLSSFFALLATHGLHITIGLIWLATLILTMGRGVNEGWLRRLASFGIFWHFLDIVWVGIFAVVYMFGVGGV